MKNLAILVSTLVAGTAFAQSAPNDPYAPYAPPSGPVQPQPQLQLQQLPAQAQPAAQPAAQQDQDEEEETGWHRPVGRRFFHGFRMGWLHISHYDKPTRDNGMSLMQEFKLKSPDMFVLGYEGFYRIVGHSWLNVLMVGNVTVAGLEQSKFIPGASGLIGFEFEKSFQLGVGINLTPDPQSPSHMIAAAGWTPRVGSIQTPVHFFYIPDAAGNNRMGATLGMNW